MHMKKLFFDVETTGTDWRKHSIHQLFAILEIDGEIIEKCDIRMRPHIAAEILPEALKVSDVTTEEVCAYPPWEDGHKKFASMVDRHVDRYNQKDKIFLIGFRNMSFDDFFLRKLFELAGDNFFGARFWGNSIDVSPLASQYLIDRRILMPSFKLHRVAHDLGIIVNKDLLHEAGYDVYLTRSIYRIVTGIEIEL